MTPFARKPFPGDAGLTAIQLVVTLVVLSIMAGIAVRPVSGLLYRLRLQNAADAIKHIVLNARTRSISSPDRHCGVVFKLHPSASSLDDSVFAFLDANPPDNIYSPGLDQPYLTPYVIPRKQGIVISIPAGYPSVLVFRGDGTAISSARVALTLKSMKDTLDVLASTGRVKVIKK
jgi:type II secretory pathway pseudopilin PulG